MLAAPEPQKAQNIFHVLNKRNYDLSLQQESDLKACTSSLINHRLINNMTSGNSTKTICNGQNPVLVFDVKEYLAATYCWNTALKLWNLDTGKCLWTVENLLPTYGKILVKIVEDKVVFAGFEGLDEQTTTRIFDLKSGKETASFTTWNEENETRICAQVCIIGKRIFTLENGNISEWNLEGKCVRYTKLYNAFPASIFVGQGNFLVYISEKDITIRDLEKKQNLKIKINAIDEKVSISCASLDGSRLICGIIDNEQTKPSCCVIDLHSGEIIQHYPGKDEDGNRMYLSELCKIRKIIADKEWIYLANDHEKIIAINLTKNTHQCLGVHKSHIHSLILKDGILISASGSNFLHKAELKFWDTKTLKLLATNEFMSLSNNIMFDSGKVFAGVEKSLIQWDYLASHEGEKLSAHSAPEIETDPGARNCIVQ